MINKIRKLLLILIIGVLGVSVYYIFGGLNSPIGNIKLKAMDSGIAVEIENFKIVNKVSGKKEWELKADLAQVTYDKKLTRLKNVELKMDKGEGREFKISADRGIYQNETKNIDLIGNVKMVGQPRALLDRLHSGKSKTSTQRETDVASKTE